MIGSNNCTAFIAGNRKVDGETRHDPKLTPSASGDWIPNQV